MPYRWFSSVTNAQGMLTAMKQEVTRKHKAEKWALDDVVYHTEVTSYERMEQARICLFHLVSSYRHRRGAFFVRGYFIFLVYFAVGIVSCRLRQRTFPPMNTGMFLVQGTIVIWTA